MFRSEEITNLLIETLKERQAAHIAVLHQYRAEAKRATDDADREVWLAAAAEVDGFAALRGQNIADVLAGRD